MIPKVIHYIWLSQERPDPVAAICLRSWKQNAPDYTIRRWTLADFDPALLPPYVREALQAKKWAFACDYLRLYVLYREGGFYLDSDVLLRTAPDAFLSHDFVSAVEYYPELYQADDEPSADCAFVSGMALQAAVMGSVPGHPFLKTCMDRYADRHFDAEEIDRPGNMLAPHSFAFCARAYGFRYVNELQRLRDGMVIYPASVFAPGIWESTADSVMIHLCSGSWRKMSRYRRLRYRLSLYRAIRKL